MISWITSGLVSSVFGGILGLGQKYLDLKQHKMDQEHEVRLREKDMEQTKIEIEGRTKVAEVQATGAIAVAEAGALAASYEADKATYGIKFVDGVRGVMRPLITAGASIELYIFGTAAWAYIQDHGGLTSEQAYNIVQSILDVALMVVAWWFGSRPKSRK